MKYLMIFTLMTAFGCQSLVKSNSNRAHSSLGNFKNQDCSKLPFIRIHSENYSSLVVAYSDSTLKDEAQDILDSAEVAMSELNQYFGKNYSSTYTIYLLKNRDALDEFVGEKTKDWVVGRAWTNFDNLILSQAGWTENSKSFVKLPKLVKHEMIHSYIYQMTQPESSSSCRFGVASEGSPYWFYEGFATFVSGQLGDWGNRVKTGQETPPTIFETLTKGNYATAATVIEFMMQEKGKTFVVELHKTLANAAEKGISLDEKMIDALGGQAKFTIFNEGWKAHILKNYPAIPK